MVDLDYRTDLYDLRLAALKEDRTEPAPKRQRKKPTLEDIKSFAATLDGKIQKE